MVYGTVDYNYHDGAQKGTEWAARVKLAREEKKLKMSLYHVFLVRIGSFLVHVGLKSLLTVPYHRTLQAKSSVRIGFTTIRLISDD